MRVHTYTCIHTHTYTHKHIHINIEIEIAYTYQQATFNITVMYLHRLINFLFDLVLNS